MSNLIENNYMTLDGTLFKGKKAFFDVKNLRLEQIKKIKDYEDNYKKLDEEKDYIGKEIGISNIGWVSPKNIVKYYCFNCNANYSESPKMEVIIEQDFFLAQGNLSCNYCGEFLSAILAQKDDALIEKEFVICDETGKIIPYTRQFIDKMIEKELSSYNMSCHLLHRFSIRTDEWIQKANIMGYKIDKSEILKKVKKETIEKTINYIGTEDLSADYRVFSMLNRIINVREDNYSLKKLLQNKLYKTKELAKSLTKSLFKIDKERQELGLDEKTDLMHEFKDYKKEIKEIYSF